MKIVSFYSPIPGRCPVGELQLLQKWRSAWSKVGLEPFIARGGVHIPPEPSKCLLGAFTAHGEAIPQDFLPQFARSAAESVLRKGECAYLTHYDVFPDADYGWHREEPENLLIWEDVMAFGSRWQLSKFTDPLPGPALKFVRYNTPELRAQLGIRPVTWPVDKPVPKPTIPTGQFTTSFRF